MKARVFCRWTVSVCLILLMSTAEAETKQQRLYINAGHLFTFDGDSFPYLSCNETLNFEPQNKVIQLAAGDSLILWIRNTDSVSHGWQVKGQPALQTIAAGDSATLQLHFPAAGTFIYSDPLADGNFGLIGLSGIVHVADPQSNAVSFYWNIKDHQVDFHRDIREGKSVNWEQYSPSYFTINGRSNPDINTDSTARVRGSVGDTLLIHMVNTGKAVHSIHFHGYHSEIVQSSKFPEHKGRSKDTFPVYGHEVVVLRLVPHQVGEYPVHDHNLVAVTGGNIYPNGMFLTLLIQ